MPTHAAGIPWFVYALTCCWPAPIPMGLVALLMLAIQKGWLNISVKTNLPKRIIPTLNWKRNR